MHIWKLVIKVYKIIVQSRSLQCTSNVQDSKSKNQISEITISCSYSSKQEHLQFVLPVLPAVHWPGTVEQEGLQVLDSASEMVSDPLTHM